MTSNQRSDRLRQAAKQRFSQRFDNAYEVVNRLQQAARRRLTVRFDDAYEVVDSITESRLLEFRDDQLRADNGRWITEKDIKNAVNNIGMASELLQSVEDPDKREIVAQALKDEGMTKDDYEKAVKGMGSAGDGGSGAIDALTLKDKLPLNDYGTPSGTLAIGPVKVKAYRTGDVTNNGQGGVFFSGDAEGAEEYRSLHNDEPVVGYEVELQNPILVGHQGDLTRKYFKKPYGEMMDSYQLKYGRKGADVATGKFDAALIAAVKKDGHDGIIYVAPAPPAKTEVVVFGKSEKDFARVKPMKAGGPSGTSKSDDYDAIAKSVESNLQPYDSSAAQASIEAKYGKKEYAYHGTTTANLPSILRDGLKPRGGQGASQDKEQNNNAKVNGTIDAPTARQAAAIASEASGSKPVVLVYKRGDDATVEKLNKTTIYHDSITPDRIAGYLGPDGLQSFGKSEPQPSGSTSAGSGSPKVMEWAKAKFGDDTKAKNFTEWFGESKVVDEKGEPLVVYHGTDKAFDEFNPSVKGMLGPGVYASAKKEDYGPYSSYAQKDNASVMPVYMKIEKPWIATGGKLDTFPPKEGPGEGYDGIILIDPRTKKTSWSVALNPNQIKSATANKGTFSKDSNKINESRLLEFKEDQLRDDHGRWTDEDEIPDAAKSIPKASELLDRFQKPANREDLAQALKDNGMSKADYDKAVGGSEKSVSKKAKDAARVYVDQPGINDLLRQGIPLDSPDIEGDYSDAVRAIDKGMMLVKEETTLYRGTRAEFIPEVGETFTDEGYTSTSRSKLVALKFMPKELGTAANVKVIVPEGYKTLPIEGEERETILPRGTTFRVESKDKTLSGYRVTVKVVDQKDTTTPSTSKSDGASLIDKLERVNRNGMPKAGGEFVKNQFPLTELEDDMEEAMAKEAKGFDGGVQEYIDTMATEETVDLGNLESVQNIIDPKGIKYFLKNKHEGKLPLVVQYKGKNIVRDGNTRLNTELLKGNDKAKARVLYVPDAPESDDAPAGKKSYRIAGGADVSSDALKQYENKISNRMGELENSGEDEGQEYRALGMMSRALTRHGNLKLSEKQFNRSAFAFDGESLVGAGSMEISKDKKKAHIDAIGSTSRGAGSSVLGKLLSQAKEAGVKTVTADASDQAIAMNKKFGFVATGEASEDGTPMQLDVSKQIREANKITEGLTPVQLALLESWKDYP